MLPRLRSYSLSGTTWLPDTWIWCGWRFLRWKLLRFAGLFTWDLLNRPPSRRRPAISSVQQLEPRILLSAEVVFSTPVSEILVAVPGNSVQVYSENGRVSISPEPEHPVELSSIAVTAIDVHVDSGGHDIDLGRVRAAEFPNLAHVAVSGNDGPDTILGSGIDDLLIGGGGDDVITGGDGHDEIRGGSGNDTLNGNHGNDTLLGQADDDKMFGGSGRDSLLTGGGWNRAKGHAGGDVIVGGSGRDVVDGGSGPDRINGRGGNDRLQGGTGDDQLLGGSGSDSVRGGPGDDRLRGQAGVDFLFGDSGDDRIVEFTGANLLVGSSGNDLLQGGSGRDLMIGGDGVDRLRGGPGEDLLVGSVTSYDSQPDQLERLLAAWTDPNDYLTRISQLTDDRMPVHLGSDVNVHDDDRRDELLGEEDRDWFFQPSTTRDQLEDNGVNELVNSTVLTNIAVPAFPGAEGYAATTIGGRGGRVIEVTNLHDQGLGSLRAAVESEGPRVIVFRVGGTITLLSELLIAHPDLTIAGQTAPGEGVSVTYGGPDGGQLHGMVTVATHNVIIRHLRLRRGEVGDGGDSLRIRGGSTDVLIDHVSVSWGTDENIDIYSDDGLPIRRVTIQDSLIGPALDTGHGAAMGVLVGGRKDDDSWRQLSEIDLHGNAFVHNTHRNPRVVARGVKIVNNVIYNWKSRAGSTERDAQVDWIGNVLLWGPQSNVASDRLLFHATTTADGQTVYPDAEIHIAGNLAPDLGFDEATADNWQMITDHYLRSGETRTELPVQLQRLTPLPDAEIPITVDDANSLLSDTSLAGIGATSRLDENGDWVTNRDPVDERLITDITAGSGPDNTHRPSTAVQAGRGYAPSSTSAGYADRDHDGMSDTWEIRHHLDPSNIEDGPADFDLDGWSNLDEFLNGTHPRVAG